MYASRDDLIDRFGENQIIELEINNPNGSMVTERALSDATEEMHSYLAKRYGTPLVKTEHLKLICCNIARYLMYCNDPTDEVTKRYDDAIKWLKDVRDGKNDITFNEPLTLDETKKAYVLPVTGIGDSYKGKVFGDDVFATMPSV